MSKDILHFMMSMKELYILNLADLSLRASLHRFSLCDEGRLHQSGTVHTHIVTCCILHVCAASQMWNLAVFLPLMIGEQVPDDDDDEWECDLLLLSILQICVSCVLSFDLVDHLRVLIELYLASFRKCYPHMSIIPKQHYLIYLLSQILKYI